MCFQPPSSLIGKVLALVMPFCAAHTVPSVLEMGQEARMVLIDFSAALSWKTSSTVMLAIQLW